jgi:hypothetical protein
MTRLPHHKKAMKHRQEFGTFWNRGTFVALPTGRTHNKQNTVKAPALGVEPAIGESRSPRVDSPMAMRRATGAQHVRIRPKPRLRRACRRPTTNSGGGWDALRSLTAAANHAADHELHSSWSLGCDGERQESILDHEISVRERGGVHVSQCRRDMSAAVMMCRCVMNHERMWS